MRKSLFLIALVLAGCGGDGDGFKQQPVADQHPPNIFNLTLSPASLDYMEGGGSTLVTAEFGFNDAGRDIVSLEVKMPDGSTVSIDIAEKTGEQIGKVTEQVSVATTEVGPCRMEFRLVDSEGDSSQQLTGYVLVAGNSSDWRQRLTGLPHALNAVASWWGDPKFVAVGDGGTIVTSADGIAWTLRDSGTEVNLHDVICDPYACYAVGDYGTVLRSWDGETWEETWDGPDDFSLRTIGNNLLLLYIAGTNVADDTPVILRFDFATSAWVEVDLLPQGGTSITGIATSFGIPPDTYVATQEVPFPDPGTLLTSADGRTWIEVAISSGHESTYSPLFDGERFWVGGTAGHVYSSADGVNWMELQTPAQMSSLTAMVHTGSLLLAHGTNEFFGLGDQVGVMTEDAGATWQTFQIGEDYETRGLAYADGRFVSVGRTLPVPGQGAIYSTF